VISAPPGSGKTVLLQSWINEVRAERPAAYVLVDRDQGDPQHFWRSALDALRSTPAGLAAVQPITPAPDLDGWAIVERLLADLTSLEEELVLIIDDAHALVSSDAAKQLELLLLRAPPQLRFVLAGRHQLRLGLHRLRLEGDVHEIRAEDLRFTLPEARALFTSAGIKISDQTLEMLHARTEGWVAGLRLAALSLVGHPDPEAFAAEFSGSERMVAEYLLAEVLERQSDEVRQLLLRTSILERVNGPLADLLTGTTGGERILHDLEQVNAFVAAADTARSWFRYHQMFAGLLAFELRRTAPDTVPVLHRLAAGWFAEHGHMSEAMRHAQAAGDWGMTTSLLTQASPGLFLDGRGTVVHELLGAFPPEAYETGAELAAVAAADELGHGSLARAQNYLSVAETHVASIPGSRRGQTELLVAFVRLQVARQRGDVTAAVQEADRLQAMADDPEASQAGMSEELRALALVNLGIAEVATSKFDGATRHLQQGVELARRIGRPYLEMCGQTWRAGMEFFASCEVALDYAAQATALAKANGWGDEPTGALASALFGAFIFWQGRIDEAEVLLRDAQRGIRQGVEPAAELTFQHVRGVLDLARNRPLEALADFDRVEQLVGGLTESSVLRIPNKAWMAHALVRLGQLERAERILDELSTEDSARGEIRISRAVICLERGDAEAATSFLAPVIAGDSQFVWPTWVAHGYMVEAIARDRLGDADAADAAVEAALDAAETDGAVTLFLMSPAPELIERHARHETKHGSLIADIQSLFAGESTASPAAPERVHDALSESEIRVLRYLPTNLSGPEIAAELYLSPNTIKTHMRNLYSKLGTHDRKDTVERARNLGLLAPSARRQS
jgi:LuxR family transcriptional regulator, maltose regulon positive regulatory protein